MGWHNPPISWREFERRLSWAAVPEQPAPKPPATDRPAAADPDRPGDPTPRSPGPRPPTSGSRSPGPRPPDLPSARRGPAWAELHCHSAYSFLDGVGDPADLVAEAARLGVEAIGLTDHDGFYGVVRLAEAARERGVGTVFGAELSLDLATPQGGVPDPAGSHLLVLARDAEGYRRLARVVSAAQLRGRRGRPVYDRAELAAELGGPAAGHVAVLTGCRKGAVPAALERAGPAAAERALRELVETFGRTNVAVELIDHDQPTDDDRNDALFALAGRVGVTIVASNNVHYPAPDRAPLAQAVAAVRARRSLDEMAGWLAVAGTAHLRSGAEMAARLVRYPGVREATVRLARDCAFDLRVVAPRLPRREVGAGHTDASWLRKLTYDGAAGRYGPPGPDNAKAYAQIEHELAVIEKLDFPGYFLIVHEITQFCERNGILCQGRGSAANSAVCYALGITSVDPVAHQLLFERFLSVGRDGPPDIDVDIENGRREEVIQHVYEKYGRDRAAQVANVNTYRPKMAIRDVARALGYSPGQADVWCRSLDFSHGPDDGPRGEKRPSRWTPRRPAGAVAGAPASPAARPGTPAGDPGALPGLVGALALQLQRLPRHLSIHSGGMVLADRPIGEVCPVEWAAMENRSILQWDKDDCAAAGLVKFDLLGLGMLAALHDAFDLVAAHHGVQLSLHTVPAEDSAVYDMLCDADSVGVFQVESRAQMATLPRLRPRRFYDLVVEVALIRPGPIQGGSVHPYLRRHSGAEPVTYPHPSMKKALERTLGVPLFQEQMMQLAIDCAGFDPAQADRLRQAMGAKRAPEKVAALRDQLLAGMAERGITGPVAEDIYHKLMGFASYGFPESHAFSFAYLVYASAYLKRYYPAAFTVGLLRNQPMGFYSPQALVADARRHGVQVRGVDVNASDVAAGLAEPVPVPAGRRHAPAEPQPVIRLGLSGVRGLGADVAAALAAGRPYRDLEDLARRVRVPAAALEALATAGAFGCFGLSRRAALWAVGALAGVRPGQLPGTTPGTGAPALPAMTPVERTFADLWATGVSPDSHPFDHVRAALAAAGAVPAADLPALPHGARVRVGGLVTHRQRPPTAGGVVFVNLEDETGLVNVVCSRAVWEHQRKVALTAAALLIDGRLERADGAVNLLAERLRAIPVTTFSRSRDFR